MIIVRRRDGTGILPARVAFVVVEASLSYSALANCLQPTYEAYLLQRAATRYDPRFDNNKAFADR